MLPIVDNNNNSNSLLLGVQGVLVAAKSSVVEFTHDSWVVISLVVSTLYVEIVSPVARGLIICGPSGGRQLDWGWLHPWLVDVVCLSTLSGAHKLM